MSAAGAEKDKLSAIGYSEYQIKEQRRMMDLLVRLEGSGVSTWIRNSSSLFAYPFILFLHTIGMGLIFGITTAVNLRILGFAPRISLGSMQRFLSIMWIGFWLNAASGIALVVAQPTTKIMNPALWVKLALAALAVVITYLIKSKVFRDPFLDKRPVPINGRLLAVASILLWAGAITAGRLMAYIDARF